MYNSLVEQLALWMQQYYDLPIGSLILETGAEPDKIEYNKLPMGIIQATGEMDIIHGPNIEWGVSAKEIVTVCEFNLWVVRKAVKNENNMRNIRAYLVTLRNAILADRRLNQRCTFSYIRGINWAGVGTEWPFEILKGAGLAAGYLKVAFGIVELTT